MHYYSLHLVVLQVNKMGEKEGGSGRNIGTFKLKKKRKKVNNEGIWLRKEKLL